MRGRGADGRRAGWVVPAALIHSFAFTHSPGKAALAPSLEAARRAPALQPGGLGSSPPLCSSVGLRLCGPASVSPSLKPGGLVVAHRWLTAASAPAPSGAGSAPHPGPASCVSPTLFSGAPRPLLPAADIPGPGAPGNIPWFAADCPAPRRLRCGQSGRRPGGRGLGTGETAHPDPHPSARHTAGEVAGCTYSRAGGGGPPLLRALPGLPGALCTQPTTPHRAHKACATSPDPSLPSPLHSAPATHGPPRHPPQHARPGRAPGPLHMLCSLPLELWSIEIPQTALPLPRGGLPGPPGPPGFYDPLPKPYGLLPV